ncbi:SAM-dependent methyltransferase [Nocardiopsis sp. NPDC049922]|uniref:SAM-dependent methyltransferase n=1 Tax=Nocardiopsis sp. NPDC049922 TaxID=3155157 RepID=UPI0033F70B06
MADRFPPDIDMDTPSIARMYDYLLGGKDNFEVDRVACNVLLDRVPEVFSLANDNRAYLTRAVEFVASRGVEQFLDLGAGLPTAENTHHVAQRANPGARVVYVDNDPIVAAHGRALIDDGRRTAFLHEDFRAPERILEAPETRRLIDTDLPVCLMAVSLLHCVPDDEDPFGALGVLVDRLAPGSYVIFSHCVTDDAAAGEWITAKIRSFGTPWGRVRSVPEAAAVFAGLELVSPWTDERDSGPRTVDCATWRHPDQTPLTRPEDPEIKLWEMAGVAVKR